MCQCNIQWTFWWLQISYLRKFKNNAETQKIEIFLASDLNSNENDEIGSFYAGLKPNDNL